MRIERMLKMLFSPRSERNEEVTRQVAAALAAHAEASDRLNQTISDLLEENDRVTGRKPHVRKSSN
jgi:hypothetical protein